MIIVVWYLIVKAGYTSQSIPQISKEQCLQNAAWVKENTIFYNAYCIPGAAVVPAK